MTAVSRARLDQAVRSAAECLAFLDAVPADRGPEIERPTCVRIGLIEPDAGQLLLRLSEVDADEMGRAAWGAYGSGSAEQADQFLFELVNVVAGHYLASAHPGVEVRIGFPERVGAELWPPGEPTARYDLEGRGVEIALVSV